MNITDYLKEQTINEGGASGHLKHIVDYNELTLDNLKGIIYSLFNGRIDDVTEKIDGTNIQASMNDNGYVVFIRNKGDLNSEQGGMSVDDMVEKWKGNKSVQETFVESGKVIEKIFKKVGKSFFNPNKNTRIFANCECMKEGTTNIMPYASSMVCFHDLWVYERQNGEWVNTDVIKTGLDKLNKAMEDIDGASITPKVIINATEKGQKIMKWYMAQCNNIFKSVGCNSKSTIEDYKRARFNKWCAENANWVNSNTDGAELLFRRIVNYDKSTNIREIKKMYGMDDKVKELDNSAKEINRWIMKDLDELFLKLGNSVIQMCDGFINSGNEAKVIDELKSRMEDVVDDIMNNADSKEDTKTKLMDQLNRLNALGDKNINAAEGIVFNYKGRLMKLTGGFAPLNQILGSLKFQR